MKYWATSSEERKKERRKRFSHLATFCRVHSPYVLTPVLWYQLKIGKHFFANVSTIWFITLGKSSTMLAKSFSTLRWNSPFCLRRRQLRTNHYNHPSLKSLQGYHYQSIGYSQGNGTGSDGASTGASCVAQLLTGYVCVSGRKMITTHSSPLSIDVDLQSTRCVGAAGHWPMCKPQVSIAQTWSYDNMLCNLISQPFKYTY